MVKKKEFKPIMVEVINPEALGHASELVTQYFYQKYLEMRSMEVRVKADEVKKKETLESQNKTEAKMSIVTKEE